MKKLNKNIFICALLVVMMLACVSAVSAEDNLDADLAVVADDAVDLSIDDVKGSETLTEGGSSGEILAADKTVVTNDTFFNYFDENGVINKSISGKELTFDGEFSDLGIDTITIDVPVTLSGENIAMFNNIGFKILSDNVNLTDFAIQRDIDGVAIDIKANDVTIDSVGIGIISVGKNDTFAVRAIESDNFNLLNSVIVYYAGYDANSTSIYQHVVQVRDSNNVNIKRNRLNAKLPALDVDWSGVSGIDKDHPLALGIQNGENITVAENDIVADVTGSYGFYTTLDAIMVDGTKKLNIIDNNITETDFNGEGKAGYLYALDLYGISNAFVSENNILVNTSTGVEGAGAAYDIQVTGPCSDLAIVSNTFVAEGKGPVLGIYAADWAGSVEMTIMSNLFDITGLAGSGRSALVSAMELQATDVSIFGNQIHTASINAYNESNRLFGISYAQDNKRNHTFDIDSNYITTEGKYAIFLMNVANTTVTDNTLFGQELYGDAAVYVDSGSSVVENNTPEVIITNDTFFNYFDENGVLKNISANELTFDGMFSGLGIDTIVINAPKSIVGLDDAVFENIGFKVLSDDVELTNFVIVRDVDGAAIDIQGNDVAVHDVQIDVYSVGKEDAFAIRAISSDGLILVDNYIIYEAGYDANRSGSIYQHVIQIRDSNNAFVKRNYIDAKLPALDVDWSGVGIDMDHPLVVGIQNGENITFAENEITVDVSGSYGFYTTLDAVMVNGAKNLYVLDNKITETDFNGEGKAGYLYALDLYGISDVYVGENEILVNTSTGVEGAGAAYDIQVTGPCSGLIIDGNYLYAEGKGPVLGIYAADWAGPVEMTISNNVFDITGFAGSGRSALVSGMELQATVVDIFGNQIHTASINAYNESDRLFGISYAQDNKRNHTFNITGNFIETGGKYAIYVENVVNTTITENTLFAHELYGDAAVYAGSGSYVVEDNYPVDVFIDAPSVWTGNNGNITVTVPNATGTVTIRVGNKLFEGIPLVNGTASQVVDAADLAEGANAVDVEYYVGEKVAGLATGNLEVLSGVITADTFKYYFDADNNNYLVDAVPEGATLDFQGSFISDNYTLYINKPVNVISSTNDALFDSNTSNRKWIMFNVVEGANNTNITGINLLNADLFIEAPYVTVDNITAIAKMQGVGSGTGFVVFRTDAAHGTIKNSYLENGGTGSSILVAGYGAPYLTIDNNIVNVTGSSGNLMGANAYVGSGVTPGFMTVTNNQIYNEQSSTSSSYAVTLMGSYNVVENNTVKHNGAGIVNANIAWASGAKDPMENNTYRNNVLTGCGITAAIGSVVENNTMTGALSLSGANITVVDNTAGSMTIGTTSAGGNIVVDNNIINGAVTINKAAANTTFTNNYVKDAVTVNSNDNVITDNQISTEKAYAVDLKSTSGNTVQYNTLSSADKMGDAAVKYAEGNNNTVSLNGMNAIITIDANNAWSGDNNTINITVVNATGTVNVEINGNEYKDIPLVDGAAKFTIPANNIEVGLNDVTVTYNGNKVISSDSKDATFYGLDNVVFTEVFFEFFDENGILRDSVPYDDLIFKGAFTKAKTVQYIVLDKPVSISSDDASLSLMGIVIGCDNVTIDGLKLTATVNSAASALGDLITVNANNVTLTNLDINYKVTRGDYNAIAINAFGADNVTISNNNIVFASVISTDEYSANAINLDGVTNALVDNNTITTTLPGLLAENYDFDYFMMGLNTVNPVRIRASQNITLSNNNIESKVNNLGKTTPTIQALLVVGSTNVLVDSNSFKMVDTISKAGSATYLYAFNFGYDKNLTVTNNDFYMSTTGGKDSAGAAYALQGVESEIYVVGNNITTISNGPNLGFYVSSMMGGSSESYIANNFINVTGNATTSQQWALISGIEITNGNAYIYNNTIFTYNKAGYVDVAPVHGVSYGQYMYGERSLDVQNNTIITQGKYTVSVLEGTPCNVTYNTLYAEELFGDDSVAPGYVGIVENNTPPFDAEIIIDTEAAWIGTNSTVTVTVPGSTGNVTIVVGNKTYKDVPLVNGTVTVPVDATDLVDGANPVNVTYNSDLYIKAGNATGNLQVISGVITNETFFYYFNKSNGNKLADIVPEGVTLDFQGPFIGAEYSVYINKPENIVSTTGDAVFDSGEKPNRNWVKFNVIEGANNTNISDIIIINGDLFIQGASYVTVDGIYMKANMSGVGSGTGFLSIHTGANNTLVKNSYFENGGTGSSLLVLGKGGAYATFDNNVFNITGSSGNILSANQYVGTGAAPEHVAYTNNVLYNSQPGSPFCYAMTVSGSGNLVENNTIYHNGSGILNQYGATSSGNVYRNNTLYGNTNFNPSANSIVENNKIYATTNIAANTTVLGNTFNNVAISGTNTKFLLNNVSGTVTVKGNENIIVANVIVSDGEYAVDLQSTANNTVTENVLYASELYSDAAVKYDNENNTVEGNAPFDAGLNVEVNDIFVGEDAVVNITFTKSVYDYVEVIVDGKSYTVNIFASKGQLIVPGLAASTYSVSVTYLGNILYTPSENATKFTVSKIETEGNVTIGEVVPGQDVPVTIAIPGATGNVSVIVDGVETIVPLDENGTANYTIPAISAGDHSVVVIYGGDDTHDSVYTSAPISVKVLATEFTNIVISGDMNISAVLVDEEGNPVANAVIDYTVGDLIGNVTTGADGSFVIAGENNAVINIKYAGNASLFATNVSIALDNIAPVDVKVASNFVDNKLTLKGYAVDTKAGEQGMAYANTLLDANGKPISGAKIQFAVNDKIYNRTTKENGSFNPYNLNMVRAGRYTMAFSFGGNDQYNSTFAVVCIDLDKKPIKIKASNKSYKVSATKKYTVTLSTIVGSSADGKAHLRSGMKVTMKIDGKTYTGKTNSKGQVTFNLKITKKGKFSATISTSEDATYETTTKSVKITIN